MYFHCCASKNYVFHDHYILYVVELKSTTKNPRHNVWRMHVCVEATVQKTFNDNADALDKSVKAGLNVIKGIGGGGGKLLVKFNQCFTMAWQIKIKTNQRYVSDSAFEICPYKTANLLNHSFWLSFHLFFVLFFLS